MNDELNEQADVFFRANGVFVMPVHLYKSGEPACGLPVIGLPADVDAASLGQAIFMAFEENRNDLPGIGADEHEALLQSLATAAGAANWDELERESKSCTVWTDEDHLVIQKLEHDPEGGFAYVSNATVRFPRNAQELGRRLLEIAPTLR